MKPHAIPLPYPFPNINPDRCNSKIQLPPLASLAVNENWSRTTLPPFLASPPPNTRLTTVQSTLHPTSIQLEQNQSLPNKQAIIFAQRKDLSIKLPTPPTAHSPIYPTQQSQHANRNPPQYPILQNANIIHPNSNFPPTVKTPPNNSTTQLSCAINRDISSPLLSQHLTENQPTINQPNSYITQILPIPAIHRADLYNPNQSVVTAIPITLTCQNSNSTIPSSSNINPFPQQQVSTSTYLIQTPINLSMLQPSIQSPHNDNTTYLIQPPTPPPTTYITKTQRYTSTESPVEYRGMIHHKTDVDLYDRVFNPLELNFLPKELFATQSMTLKYVIENFFHARSTKNLRFEHKLWNALALSTHFPDLIHILGIQWVSNDVLKVNRDRFGSLINVTKPSAALFNNQGSFQTHRFLEVSKHEAIHTFNIPPASIEDVDESVVRLYRHSDGLLRANSQKTDIHSCRWNR